MKRHSASLTISAVAVAFLYARTAGALPSGCTVSLPPSEPAPQLVGERITWTATAPNCGATPVYQFSVAERPTAGARSRGPRLQPRQHVRLDADAGGHLRHRGHRQGRLPGDRDDLRRGDRRGRLAGDRVAGRRHAHRSTRSWPCTASRPRRRGNGVRPVRRGGRPPGLAEHRRARRRAGEEHELLRRGHAAQHDLPDAARVQRRTHGSAPLLFTTGSRPRR